MTTPDARDGAATHVIERWFLDLAWSWYLARCLNRGETPDERYRDNAASREQATVWTEQVLAALSSAGLRVVPAVPGSSAATPTGHDGQ